MKTNEIERKLNELYKSVHSSMFFLMSMISMIGLSTLGLLITMAGFNGKPMIVFALVVSSACIVLSLLVCYDVIKIKY